MSEKRTTRATITFFGEPRRTPEPSERVMLRVADGSWREDFRCISAPFIEDGERGVWVAPEEEYRRAQREEREPAGDTWPLDQLAG